MKTIKNWRKATPEEIENGSPEMILVDEYQVEHDEVVEVSLWKLRAILSTMGLTDQIHAIINDLHEPDKTIAFAAWEYGTVINSNSPIVQVIKNSLGMSDETLNSIFTNALNLNA